MNKADKQKRAHLLKIQAQMEDENCRTCANKRNGRYCIDVCPVGIDMKAIGDELLNITNGKKREGQKEMATTVKKATSETEIENLKHDLKATKEINKELADQKERLSGELNVERDNYKKLQNQTSQDKLKYTYEIQRLTKELESVNSDNLNLKKENKIIRESYDRLEAANNELKKRAAADPVHETNRKHLELLHFYLGKELQEG